MKKQSSISLNDLIFQGRNKEYGAYELRVGYARRMRLAIYTMGIFPLMIYLFTLAGRTTDLSVTTPLYQFKQVMTTTSVDFDPLKKVEIAPTAQRKTPAAATSSFSSPPKITSMPDPIRTMASQDILSTTTPGAVNLPGVPYTGVVAPVTSLVDGSGAAASGNQELRKEEVEAEFPGGEKKWMQYLERNADGEVATANEAPSGTYTVLIKFVVDTLGNIIEVYPLTNHGYGMEEEAIRVIKKGPRWVPAIQNGHRVKSYRKQPITFRVESSN